MRFSPLLLLITAALLSTTPSQAQQTPAAVADSAAAPVVPPATGAATDVIVRTNGDELPGRVLRITPQLVRYLALPATDSLGQAAADTLQLAAAEVFMVRFANGTKEVLQPTPASDPNSSNSLLGLSAAQRAEQGRRDSQRYYRPAKGVFWGTFAGTVVGYGVGGLVTGGAIALTPPARHNLNAPQPELLNDPAYYDGYRQQAQNRKLGKAAAGFGVGVGAEIALFIVLLSILLRNGFS